MITGYLGAGLFMFYSFIASVLAVRYYHLLNKAELKYREEIRILVDINKSRVVIPQQLVAEKKTFKILDDRFDVHPQLLVKLLKPFIASEVTKDAVQFDLSLYIESTNPYLLTAKTAEHLVENIEHILAQNFMARRDTGELVWKKKTVVQFYVKFSVVKYSVPVLPPIHYVQVAVPFIGDVTDKNNEISKKDEVSAPSLLEDKDYVNALVEVAIEEQIRKLKIKQ